MHQPDKASSRAELGRRSLLELLGDDARLPADAVIARLAVVEIGTRPAVPLALVIARADEFRDRLLAEAALSPANVTARLADVPDERHAYFLHILALYLLALWEEPRAYKPIVAYLAADSDVAALQLHESLETDLPAILARTYDGSDLAPLKAIIEDRTAPYLVREACLRALNAMAKLGKLKREDVAKYFLDAADAFDPADRADWADCLVVTLAEMQEPALRALIDSFFDAGLVDETLVGPEDIVRLYAEPADENRERLVQRELFDNLTDYVLGWGWFNVDGLDALADFEGVGQGGPDDG